MLFGLGPTELILIFVVIILLFGVGRISKLGGEVGSAIREFRKGIGKKEPEEEEKPVKKSSLN
jgi:sec-independent protein translocase protein TatA